MQPTQGKFKKALGSIKKQRNQYDSEKKVREIIHTITNRLAVMLKNRFPMTGIVSKKYFFMC